MRQLSALLSSFLLISLAYAQNRSEPIRLCISTLQNSSRTVVDTTWQRNQLVKAFERNNKGKDVAKGKAAGIETVLLESNAEADLAVRENNCQFILHTNLVEVIDAGTSDIGNPRPRSIVIGGAQNDPRADASNDNRATVSYRSCGRANWHSGRLAR